MMARWLLALALACSLGVAAAQNPSAPAATSAASAPAQAQAAPVATVPAPATVQPAAQAPGYAASPAAGSLLQTIFALTLVLGLLAGLAWFMKRYGPKAVAGAANLRIVGALNLGGRERIMVVEVGDQWIVVGASPGRVNALATMPKQEGALQPATLNEHAPAASSFAEWLKQTIDKRNAK